MKILPYQDAPSQTFDNDVAKSTTGRVLIGKADQANNFCMRIFTVAPEGFTPRHTHDWEHEIFVHSGKGQVFKQGGWQPVEAGTAIFIPGGEEHQMMNNGDEDFVFVCLIPSGPDEL